MLLHLIGNMIIAHNKNISKEDAQKHINDVDCFWIDGLVIEYPPHEENQMVEMYLNDDNTIRYEVVDIPIESSITLEDVKKDIESLQEDNLVVMGAQAKQYEGQQAIQQDMLAVMSAIAELYEMVTGGSK